MADFHRTKTGVASIRLTWLELANYSGSMQPVCDFCVKDLIGFGNITLVPILNQALCQECAKDYLRRARRHPEDAAIEKKREMFWKGFYDLQEVDA